MKVILIVGLCTFLLLFTTAYILKKTLDSGQKQLVTTTTPQSPFNGQRAFQTLEKIIEFGPRPSGSEALQKTREFIIQELENAGLSVQIFPFEANTPFGKKKMVNLIGIVSGSTEEIILLGNHYETKYFPDFPFVGANDGGSTTAWMIEMARTLGPSRQGRTIWLCFFDGEEAFKQWSREDSLYGSRQLVHDLKNADKLKSIKVMINIDMIGDKYLGIHQDPGAPSWLHSIIWSTANSLGYNKHFLQRSLSVEDDHVPFREMGIPSILLIDFMYGASLFEHHKTWHTPNDTLDKVSPMSLQIVGDVIYHALSAIDNYLDKNS